MGKMKIEGNRYDWLLVLMCWLMSAGLIGGFFQPVRILIILIIPFFIIDSIQGHKQISPSLREIPFYKYEFIFFVLWGLYAAFSIYWAIDFTESVKAFIHLIIFFFGFGEVLWLAGKAKYPQKAIFIGWLLMFLTTLPIALRELLTDQHLPMSVQESGFYMKFGSHSHEDRRFASVTFGNLNAYNVVLCLSFCIMLIQTFADRTKTRVVAFGTLIAISALIILNSSRAAIFCLILGILLYVLRLLKNRKHIFLILGALTVIAGIFIYRFSGIFSMVIYRFQDQGLEDVGRMGVLTHGIEELINSYGLGIGINNFNPIMDSKYHLDICAPHNLLLEVGVQFGVLILAGFIGIFVRIYKRAKTGTFINQSAAFLGILLLLPISIIDSGYILKATTWVYIASIYILSCPQYNATNND